MALSRSQLADELARRSGPHLVTAGLTTADLPGHLKEPLDDTLRALGTAYADVNSPAWDETDLDRFLSVGAVFILRRALDEAAGFADISATGLGLSKSKSQIVGHLREALYRAESQAASYGVTNVVASMTSGCLVFGECG